MTISQDRVIAIIKAGQDFQHAFNKLVALIDEQMTAIRENQISAEAAFKIIYMAAGDRQLEFPVESKLTLEVEHKHFKSNYNRNARNRLKAEKRRRNAGIEPRVEQDLYSKVAKAKAPAPRSNAAEIYKPIPEPPPKRMDDDPDNPENVEGGFLSDVPQEPVLPSDEELRAQSRQIVGESLRNAGYIKDK